MKGLLHSHTGFSICSSVSLEQYISRCVEQQFDFVTITDHDTIDAAIEIQKIAPFQVIIGEEISTSDGEIIGLFLKKAIPAGLSAADTIAAIKKQGGLVYLPHPFDRMRRGQKRLNIDAVLPIMNDVDIVEIANARNITVRYDRPAKKFAKQYQKIAAVGADSHFKGEMGPTYVEMHSFDGPKSFLRSLKKAKHTFVRSSPKFHLYTIFAKQYNKRFKK